MAGNTESSWESPRISFSVNLSSTDKTSPEKRKREDPQDVICSTEFEFSIAGNVNVNVGFEEENLVSADDLFVDGKILPQIPRFQSQTIKIARLSSHPRPKKETSASKSGRKLSTRWKRFFKLENHEYFRASAKEADANRHESSGPKVKPQRSRNFMSLFSKSSGQQPCWNGYFCIFVFPRNESVVERKSVEVQSACKETRSVVTGSNPAAAAGLKNRRLMEVEDSLQRDLLMRSPARNYRRTSSPGRLVVRNLGRRSCVTQIEDRVIVKGFNSPPPGKVMGKGLLKSTSVKSKATIKAGQLLKIGEPPLFGNPHSRIRYRTPQQTRFY